MTARFKVMRYKSLDGYYVLDSWPNGLSENIDGKPDNEPAFLTEAEAEEWIANTSATWLDSRQNSN